MATTSRAGRGIVLISGTNRGTGRGIAEAFLAAGYHVISLNKTLAGRPELGEISCDVRDVDAVRRAVDGIELPLSTCVVNAAVRRLEPVVEMSQESWRVSIETNLTATMTMIQVALPRLAETGGDLVVMGSHAAAHPFEGGAAYCASKAGVHALADVARLEARPLGVRVTCVSAGAIRNRDDDNCTAKMTPRSVGAVVVAVVELPRDVLVGEVEIRPAEPRRTRVTGIERLEDL